MSRLGMLLVALLALTAAPAAGAAEATLADLEDEVMCPICGTLLELSEAPQAERQRVFIARQIAAGKDKEQIKEALVDEYGEAVLALPRGSGFDLSAYLVPVIAFLLAAAALIVAVGRWRRAGARPPGSGDATDADEDARRRLDEDLARYDL